MDKYERYITLGAVIIVVTLINALLRKALAKNKAKTASLNKANTETANNIIRQPKEYLYAGIIIISSCIFSILFIAFMPEYMIVNYAKGMKLVMISVAMTIMLSGLYFIILQVIWRIEIKENEFEFTNTFGRKRTYKFDEVEVRHLSRCTRFYKNKKHIVGISMLQENYDALEKAIFRYRKD